MHNAQVLCLRLYAGTSPGEDFQTDSEMCRVQYKGEALSHWQSGKVPSDFSGLLQATSVRMTEETCSRWQAVGHKVFPLR